MTQFQKKTIIDAPLDKVYAFARDPNHWHEWFSGLRQPEKIEGKGDAGTIVNQHFQLAGVSFPLTTRVIEDHLTPKEGRWRCTFEGRVSGTQLWLTKAIDNKTEISVDLDYTIAGGALGRFADRLFIEKMQEKTMEHTLENLKTLCESEVHAPALTAK